jgi:hypothetical protein
MKKLMLMSLLLPLFAAAQILPSIEDKTKKFKKYEGFFNFYRDENTGLKK